jgi:hypothetical protein
MMVPAIDIASHSFSPNCAVIDNSDHFSLVSLVDIAMGEELTLNYGDLSNDELLSDFGFTVDNNPFDQVTIVVDDVVVNSARAVMSQSDYCINPQGKELVPISIQDNEGVGEEEGEGAGGDNSLQKLRIKVGRNSDIYSRNWLHNWQLEWIQSLIPNDHLEVSIGKI